MVARGRLEVIRASMLADVATEVGVHDQAHLFRLFGRFLGTSPGGYRASGGES